MLWLNYVFFFCFQVVCSERKSSVHGVWVHVGSTLWFNVVERRILRKYVQLIVRRVMQ